MGLSAQQSDVNHTDVVHIRACTRHKHRSQLFGKELRLSRTRRDPALMSTVDKEIRLDYILGGKPFVQCDIHLPGRSGIDSKQIGLGFDANRLAIPILGSLGPSLAGKSKLARELGGASLVSRRCPEPSRLPIVILSLFP